MNDITLVVAEQGLQLLTGLNAIGVHGEIQLRRLIGSCLLIHLDIPAMFDQPTDIIQDEGLRQCRVVP